MLSNRDDLTEQMGEIDMNRMDQSTLEQNAVEGVIENLDKMNEADFLIHLNEFFPKLKNDLEF